MLKIIDWLIISNSRAIMLQSLCGNKCSSSAQIKREGPHPRELQGEVWNVDGMGCCQAERGRLSISLSFTNKPWKTDFLCPFQISDGM